VREKTPKRARGHIGLKTAYAAAIAQLLDIPYEHQLSMDEDMMISLVQKHHDPIPHGAPFFGPDTFDNIDIIGIMAHRKESAEKTTPTIAKIKRGLTKREQKEQERIERVREASGYYKAVDNAPPWVRPKPKKQWPKGCKIQSRPFPKRGKNASADK
jgi:hypothetical protein